ncbi:MAG TPA: metallophosphoesterase [Anaeromyxobacteraceae bacterium]|nr:metallophosphoesterase [Anaeromyxobacteraceae bacterium]
MGALRDIVVVSDLHLGRGLDPRTKKYHRLEAFFYDDDFRAFCRWLVGDAESRGVPFALVLNGDVFDLLRIEPDVGPGASHLEKRFGPPPTPRIAARMLADVLAGHPVFVEALADVLAAGHEVVVISGNHDLELQWAPVQAELREALADALARRGAQGSLERFRFEPWFLYEPGRIWIEHGCQYDPENAFRYPLRSKLAGSPVAGVVAERDQPLGNFFQRYLYNAFGSITFIVPSSRANYRYFRYLLANQPRLLWRVARSQGRFLLQLVKRLSRAPDPAWQRAAEIAHQAELEELADRSGLGERLRQIDEMKFRGVDTARAATGMVRQAAKVALRTVAVSVLALLLLTACSHAIESLKVNFGWKAVLSLVLYLAFGGLGALALVAAALRLPGDEPPRPLGAAAQRISRLLDVPIVTFGHSHDEVVAAFPRRGGRGWYFNTGTWLAVFTHDVLVPRNRVQYTFLRVRGLEPDLLQWSPGRDRPMPVVMLEDEPDPAFSGLAPGGRARPLEDEAPARRSA